jgi:hypothetical protein
LSNKKPHCRNLQGKMPPWNTKYSYFVTYQNGK